MAAKIILTLLFCAKNITYVTIKVNINGYKNSSIDWDFVNNFAFGWHLQNGEYYMKLLVDQYDKPLRYS
ncbi:hypothetical protein GCM10008968_30690 [Bacillus horti]